MPSLLRYLFARMRHPSPQARGFLRGGLGIEERGNRLRRYWSLHHKASKAAQIAWLRSCPPGGSLVIHGAGRLADVAWPELGAHFSRITLVDADPLCAAAWKRAAAQVRAEVRPEIRELSGVTAAWTARVRAAAGDWDALLGVARSIRDGVPDPPPVDADAVLSVNLLSQIPLAWQDAFELELRKRFGAGRVREREREWLDAVQPGARWIVESQVRSYAAARDGLLITDLDYVYYRGCAPYLRWRHRDPPLAWDGAWRALTDGVTSEVEPALFGDGPDLPGFWDALLPAHRVSAREHWLWHIAPLGTEKSPDGVLHRVGAFQFTR